ncbi:hypothetical protein BH11BAC3_BH11BAC3_37670 [soil metagenome]
MEKLSSNGTAFHLTQYETPFADIQPVREQIELNLSSEDFFSGYFQEAESPFSRTYETTSSSTEVTQAGEEYVNLLSDLNDSEFGETIYELAREVEDTWRSKVSNEIAMGSNYIPFATQQARQYFAPLISESESMIDRVAQHFSGNNLADHSESEIESFFTDMEFDHSRYSPAQEQLFGGLWKKLKKVVKKGVNLAKKGIAAVGKILPLNIVLNKIKGLIRPLLDKVLRYAVGKLPENLRPYAQTLAKKYLNIDIVIDNNQGSNNAQTGDQDAGEDLDSIQSELDNHIAQFVFSANETEVDNLVTQYETSYETIERNNNYQTGYATNQSLETARQQFVDDLKNLQEGENPAPVIEKFIPAAIKLGISLIGRPKVVNFIAGLLAKLIKKYVPVEVARPLAASIVDIGMSSIGFEVYETGKPDLGYEAIANTIEETIQNLDEMDEAALNDSEAITMNLMEAFEDAAANNFPPQYIKEDLRPTNQRAVWVRMPRTGTVQHYKKFTHVYNINIDTQTANAVTTFRNLPLANFLKDKYGLDTAKTIKAKVHLYQLLQGGKLSTISRDENLPGLNANQPKAWKQLLPLTRQAASLLLKEPKLGKNFNPAMLATRLKAHAGQRFYYLEIDGAKLRIPPVKRTDHRQPENTRPNSATESRSADILATLNFIKSEIKLNYYFSEEDAKAVVEKLNKNDFLGAAISIKQSVKTVLNDMLLKNISTKVKIVHEALPELYLENYEDRQDQFGPQEALGKLAGKEIIAKLVEVLTEKVSSKAYEAVVNFFKARAAEFKEAQAQPQDGVTVKLTWSNVSGMSAIRTIINAVRGDLSIGNLSNLSVPSLSVPDIKIVADKKFD